MTCDDSRSLIDDYVDGAIAAGDRKALEAHLVDCDACRAMAADFTAIRRAAGSLERRVPPAHVWTKLAASFEAPRSAGVGLKWRPLAIAATLILLAGSSSWILLRQQPSATPRGREATAPAAKPVDAELAQSVETEFKLAEEHYQKAISGLEQITRSESSALDPQVAAVLKKNLEVIDHAIGESRAALQTQPMNEVAQESLFEALRNKVGLLQDTVVLINEMRKGNPEGTARAISGLNQ